MCISDWSSDVCASDLAQTIKDIFRWYCRDCLCLTEIARQLNDLQVPAGDREAWSANMVRRILSDELVLGIYVFNRTTQRLKSKPRRNPPDEIIKTKMTEPIISRVQFSSAAERLRRSEEHTSELQSLMSISYAVFCLKKKKTKDTK